MERDTEEWLRPWRAVPEVGGRGVDERDATSGISGAPAGGAAALTAPVSPASPASTASTVRVSRPSSPSRATGHPASPTSSSGSGTAVGASARPSTLSLPPPTVRPSPVLPRHGGAGHGGAGHGLGRPPPGPRGDGGAGTHAARPSGRLRAGIVGLVAGIVGAAVGTTATLAVVGTASPEPGVVAAPDASEDDAEDPATPDPTPAPVIEGPAATVVSTVAEAVLPSVVRIEVFVSEDDPDLGRAVDVPTGVGSGVIYSDDGYVLTNNHVVAGSDSVEVQFSDGTRQIAELVGTDRLTDLAVLSLDTAGLTPVTLRLDEPLRVGETAVAIGSPFGLDASVTAGVVSALNRDLEVPGDDANGSFVIPGTIQTDAAINPGNSGGALVDAEGRLIGINTAILTNNGGSQGVGFAIPTRSVVAAAQQLIDDGAVSHPFLGIAGLDVTTTLAAQYQDDYGIELDAGAVVEQIVPESGAATSGMEIGDIIVRFGDDDVAGMLDVIGAVLRYDIGATVPVEVLRDGERLTLDVTLGERPEDG